MSIIITSAMIKHVKRCTLKIMRGEIQKRGRGSKDWKRRRKRDGSCKNIYLWELSLIILGSKMLTACVFYFLELSSYRLLKKRLLQCNQYVYFLVIRFMRYFIIFSHFFFNSWISSFIIKINNVCSWNQFSQVATKELHYFLFFLSFL